MPLGSHLSMVVVALRALARGLTSRDDRSPSVGIVWLRCRVDWRAARSPAARWEGVKEEEG